MHTPFIKQVGDQIAALSPPEESTHTCKLTLHGPGTPEKMSHLRRDCLGDARGADWCEWDREGVAAVSGSSEIWLSRHSIEHVIMTSQVSRGASRRDTSGPENGSHFFGPCGRRWPDSFKMKPRNTCLSERRCVLSWCCYIVAEFLCPRPHLVGISI